MTCLRCRIIRWRRRRRRRGFRGARRRILRQKIIEIERRLFTERWHHRCCADRSLCSWSLFAVRVVNKVCWRIGKGAIGESNVFCMESLCAIHTAKSTQENWICCVSTPSALKSSMNVDYGPTCRYGPTASCFKRHGIPLPQLLCAFPFRSVRDQSPQLWSTSTDACVFACVLRY
jgi:hypothetical protein